MKKDPGQLTNVAGDPAYAAVRDRLKEELDAWQRTTGDPRATEDDDRWDRYPVLWSPRKEVGTNRAPSPEPLCAPTASAPGRDGPATTEDLRQKVRVLGQITPLHVGRRVSGFVPVAL